MRMTKCRKAIIKIFSNHPSPLSVAEIFEKLVDDEVLVNRTTVYRELNFLQNENILREVNFGEGKSRYESANEKHHHHLVCDNCGSVAEIEMDERNLLKSLPKTNFDIKSHSLEFFGLCVNCQ